MSGAKPSEAMKKSFLKGFKKGAKLNSLKAAAEAWAWQSRGGDEVLEGKGYEVGLWQGEAYLAVKTFLDNIMRRCQ